MIASMLVASAAGLVLLLGVVHLVYTFFGTKLQPGDPALKAGMEIVSPRITRETTMWQAWVGFNASHSLGAILFGLVYGYLALAYGRGLLTVAPLLAIGLVYLSAMFVLAWRYWFRIPLAGLALAWITYALGIVLSRI